MQLSLERASRIDASSKSTARNVLRQALVDINFASLPNETGVGAVALKVSDQIAALSVVLAWHSFAFVDVVLAIFSIVALFALTDRRWHVS